MNLNRYARWATSDAAELRELKARIDALEAGVATRAQRCRRHERERRSSSSAARVMSYEDTNLADLVCEIKQASANIADGDARVNKRIDELAQSVSFNLDVRHVSCRADDKGDKRQLPT